LSDGEYVWIPLGETPEGKLRVERALVHTATGDMANLYRLPFGPYRWYFLKELLVPPGDPRHQDYKEEIDAE
jgi:hypothetical protein